MTRKSWLRRCCFVNTWPVLFLLSSFALADTTPDTRKTALNTLTAQIARLQQRLSSAPSVQADLQRELRAAEIHMGLVNQQIRDLNQQLTVTGLELQKLRRVQQVTATQLAQQQLNYADQERLLYQLGKAPELKALLNTPTANMANRHLDYYRLLIEHHRLLQTGIRQTTALLEQNKTAIADEEKRLNVLLLDNREQQRQLANAHTRREAVITALNNHARTHQQEQLTLANNQKTLQTMLDTLQDEALTATTQSFDQLRGKLQWPLKGAVSTAFGARDAHNLRSSGMVIDAPEGTPVHAVSDGKVIFAGWLRGFGLLVIVNHGEGYMSLYGRNQSLFAKVGDTVQAGDVLASIGNTGGFDKTSLYFEIRRNGTPMNPNFWCT